MKRASTVEVQIRNIAFGGEGVGEVLLEVGEEESDLRGITAFVPYTAVGERVRARVEEQKRNHIRCEPGTLLEAAAERVEPPCPYFAQCGGCHFQHLSQEAQIEAKRSILVGALRAARCSHSVIQAVRPMCSAESLGYRRRVRLHVNQQGDVGFYRPKSRTVVAVSDCLVADSAIRAVIQQLAGLKDVFAAAIGSIILESDEDGVVAVLNAPFLQNERDARALLQEVKSVLPHCSLVSGDKEIARQGRRMLQLPLTETSSIQLAAGGFSQANWPVNQLLIQECLRLLEAEGVSHVYDLYAGAGNFALPMAAAGIGVTAVEIEADLVRWGEQAAAENKHIGSRLRYERSSVESFLKKNPLEKGSCVLADPPRSGLGPLVQRLHAAGSLYFISCHLPSFVRDLKQLSDLGWSVESIQAYDMFPQTTHMEILGVFRKNA